MADDFDRDSVEYTYFYTSLTRELCAVGIAAGALPCGQDAYEALGKAGLDGVTPTSLRTISPEQISALTSALGVIFQTQVAADDVRKALEITIWHCSGE
ncbi:hypothetical protein ACIRP2_39395 [Streptomyces sp. NPDC101194]|uniref:hypothetical protein n=1 Tax=Streptomyces sp. NPDC101194 TaxID=3366127 RepID=UPI00381FCA3F